MENKKEPYLPRELIEWLDELIPHRCPNPKDSFEEIWIKAGKRKLVDFLIEKHKKQQKQPNKVVLNQ